VELGRQGWAEEDEQGFIRVSNVSADYVDNTEQKEVAVRECAVGGH